jgi:hypothetical protein
MSTSVSTDRVARTLRHVGTIVRTELRRTRRNVADSARLSVTAVLGSLFLLAYTLALGAGAYFLGAGLRTGGIGDTSAIASGVLAFPAAIGVFIAAQRTVMRRGTIEQVTPLLTAIPHREIVLGIMLAEYALFVAVIGLPTLGIAAGFAIGVGSALSFLAICVTLLGLFALTVCLGFVVGVALKNVAARSRFIARHKTGLTTAISLAFFGGYVWVLSGTDADVAALLASAASPIDWYAALALVAAPGTAVNGVEAVGAAATLVIGVPLLVGASIRLTARLWYTQSVQPTPASTSVPASKSGSGSGSASAPTLSSGPGATRSGRTPAREPLSDRLFAGRVSAATRGVMQASWRRTRRAPFTLQYVTLPLFALLYPLVQTLRTGTIPVTLPVVLAFACPWAMGAAFTLNPIGGEGAILPVTLTAAVTGRQFLAGLVLAGLVPGVPVTVALVLATGIAGPIGTVGFGALVLTAVVLCGCATTLAAGLRTVFPKFERTELRGSQEAIVPSTWAFATYSAGLGLVALPGLLVGFPGPARVLGEVFDLSGTAVVGLGTGVTAVLVAVVGTLAYRHAVRTFDGYRL